jgi:hypothetical protein
MAGASIHVRHLHARYAVTGAPAEGLAVQRRLDRVARDRLASYLERRFAALAAHDGAYYFIKRMDVACALDVGADDETLAAGWATALHESVLRTIGRGGSAVKVFADRAAYLAAFLEELLRGHAWQQWYFAEFEPLRALTTGQVCVRALTADGDAGRDALRLLAARGALDLLLVTLDDEEAAEIANHCLLPEGPEIDCTHLYAHWGAALRDVARGCVLSRVPARDLMRLYLTLLHTRPELGPDSHLARFVERVLRLGAALGSDGARGSADGADALAYLARRGLAREWRLLGDLLAGLGARGALGLLQDVQPARAQEYTRHFVSDYGGVFLLAPALVDLRLHELFAQAPCPEPEFAPKAGLLRLLLGLQCLGADHAAAALRDAGVLFCAGLDAPVTRAQLQSYGARLTAEMGRQLALQFRRAQKAAHVYPPTSRGQVETGDDESWFSLTGAGLLPPAARAWETELARVSRAVLRRFAARLGAFAESSPSYLSRNFLHSRAEVRVSEERVRVHLLRCPLQLVLRMAGFEHDALALPWLDGRELAFTFA